jgi:pimeloyl-ACP methyl ester carboxylesterase
MQQIRQHVMRVAVLAVAALAVPPLLAAPSGQKVSGPQVVRGSIGPGALYELAIPANWNGDLVLFARGYSDTVSWQDYLGPGGPPTGFAAGRLGEGLLALNYGVAYSSYSEPGFAIKDGAIRTRQLLGLFTKHFGKPKRTYLIGMSMGAGIALSLAEDNPVQFDGVLPLCGIIGGSQMTIDYFFDVRVLFDYFFPGVLPSGLVSAEQFFGETAPMVVGAVFGNSGAAMELARVHQVAMPYEGPEELLMSIMLPLYFSSWDFYVGDLNDRTHGRGFFDNTSTIYTGSSDDAALNAGVARYAAAPEARAYLRQWFEPNGKLGIPMLTLHAARDAVIPYRQTLKYQALVDAAGRSDFLVRRTIDDFGHCAWDSADTLRAFQDLALWVEYGIKPEPER